MATVDVHWKTVELFYRSKAAAERHRGEELSDNEWMLELVGEKVDLLKAAYVHD